MVLWFDSCAPFFVMRWVAHHSSALSGFLLTQVTQGPNHGSVVLRITLRLLNYRSFNAFGIACQALGILLCNGCIGFIDPIMWFVQFLINGWYWWLRPSRFLLCCVLSRSPFDISVVISERSLVMLCQGASWVLGISWKQLVQGENLSVQQRVEIISFLLWFDARLIRLIQQILKVVTSFGVARLKECLPLLMLAWLCSPAELFFIESMLSLCLEKSCWF